MTDTEVDVTANTITAELQKLKPGFDVINDISSFKPASAQVTEKIVGVQRLVKESGV